MRKPDFCIIIVCESKSVTAQLIRAIVFPTLIVQSLLLNLKLQTSSLFSDTLQADLCGTWRATSKD